MVLVIIWASIVGFKALGLRFSASGLLCKV